jgi:hypothetical protein
MLLFTLITAVFVLVSVVASYVIPDIPGGVRDAHGNQQRRIHGIKNCTVIVNS